VSLTEFRRVFVGTGRREKSAFHCSEGAISPSFSENYAVSRVKRRMGVREFPEEPGLPHTRLADDRHNVALTGAGLLERLAELAQFGVTPHKAPQTSRHGSLQPLGMLALTVSSPLISQRHD
jgi:hypothetical protein